MQYSKLKKKEVVNIVTGESLGKISDLLIDETRGTINGIYVPMPDDGSFFKLKKSGLLLIPWHCIEKIGCDVILAKVTTFVKADGRTNENNGELYK